MMSIVLTKNSINYWKNGGNNMELENGYKMKTTFWMDFSIADRLGVDAVEDTYNRAVEEWKNDIEYMTELSLVLNHKIWEHYEGGRNSLVKIYNDLWANVDGYIYENFKGEDIQYYFRVTD